MNITPDYRPYLRPGVDLITAEDVENWLAHRVHPEWSAKATVRMLRARRDQERRQACRRACFATWHIALEDRSLLRAWAKISSSDQKWIKTRQKCRLSAIRRALAFRAAAKHYRQQSSDGFVI